MSAFSNDQPPSDCDVVVLGGGPAGAAAAITLARTGRSVAVLERSRYEEARIGETLPPSARVPLADLGVWQRFLSAGHLPAPGVASAWGDAALHETHFLFNPHGRGWHVDRRQFDAMLAEAARDAGARLWCGAQIASCLPLDGGWTVELTSGVASRNQRHRLRARLLIDATGRAAVVARQQGARRTNVDRLVGLAGLLTCHPGDRASSTDADGRHGGRAWTLVEACPDGWWYSALLPAGRWIAVYMTDADLLPADHGTRRAFWRARLHQTTHTRARLAALDLDAAPRVVAAGTSRLDRVCGDGWVAAGDAGMARDPLSAQGLVQALTSGVRAGEAMTRHLAGDATALAAYAARSNDLFHEYSRLRTRHYARERRWPRSDFWRRRQPAAFRSHTHLEGAES